MVRAGKWFEYIDLASENEKWLRRKSEVILYLLRAHQEQQGYKKAYNSFQHRTSKKQMM